MLSKDQTQSVVAAGGFVELDKDCIVDADCSSDEVLAVPVVETCERKILVATLAQVCHWHLPQAYFLCE